MYAMQYQIALPADYDMEIIRDRVSANSHLFDGFVGLKFKAFMIQEKSKGAPNNSYAPFYVWGDIDGMRNFCWGESGYSAIVRDFGRHPIQDWTLHKVIDGPADHTQARSLTMKTVPLPTGAAPSHCLDQVTSKFLDHVDDTTVALVTAVDVTNWNAILVELSVKEPDQTPAHVTTYEVNRPGFGGELVIP